ncbi:S-adenosyl-L-methionine-dependent methyltransferase [Fusarium oxysporum f. sp. albedinis]|nr:S-adenosyl-L-methionine-dependent methyltransferase [Fusarium oxysporum f. sp. albedinis]
MGDKTNIISDEAKALGEKNKEHFDQVAAEVFKHPWIQRLCNQISDELREQIDWIGIPERPEGNKMLDYACGNGVASRALAPYVSTVRGIDISSKMVEQYNMLAELSGFSTDKMRAIHGDLMNPEASPSPELSTPEFNDFDLIAMCMALHHVQDYAAMIQKLSEKLRPGGVLLIIDLVASSESGCPEAIMAKELSNHTMSKMGFTEMEVKTAFEKAGLEGWSWRWCSERSQVPEEIGGEQQGFFARGFTMGMPYSKQVHAAFDQVTPLVAAGFEVLRTTKNIAVFLAFLQVFVAIILTLTLLAILAVIYSVNPDLEQERRALVTPCMQWIASWVIEYGALTAWILKVLLVLGTAGLGIFLWQGSTTDVIPEVEGEDDTPEDIE